ncbi:MAG: 2-oxoglutarate dehydrogenase complex dihydrolipoyllysine-residue succinyltransferase [Burkholderiales bacterium]|jgi:2-oxoglutarate dehydrogenase E2 component (dihydrolipoamide succinyltransferase)|nr:2-oxoglutarate dehydrogenase complex dihydrolipoyllysine-residue succinyltransferase [Burkholderiales bacterium]NBP92927.1 2-oxoglutarate dehydrogenase complex dihydrolipoyllysine-residue succinyltransferase [Burkholderiaceae bacterium]NCU79272.1 2-oxoglutarate dehydrogenase complex dihydrolipoyllysine-residue succinyltransferase [Burkholderiaceae bacterium]NDB23012.1 2-oxoglutarate dehydrogenase complex dihydrolipoyllysine-residue succinyltransferase [Burkholderiaceae bacterium]NDF20584.1 2
MALFEVKVPQLSESVAEATLLQWKKKPGEAVAQDEILIEIETDKVVLEVPAPSAGVLSEIIVADGGTVVAEQVIAKIDSEGKATVAAAPKAAAPASAPAPAAVKGAIAAPSAAKLMAENNLNAAQVSGTGRDGRVTKGDVLNAVSGGAKTVSSAAPLPISNLSLGERTEERVPMTRLRARIAERLLESQANNAILTTFNEVNMAPVIAMRTRYKDTFEKTHGVKLGFMSFFVKAATYALKKYPILNASVDGNDIVYHGYFDIGIAVSSPRGLVVPILRNVDQLTLAEIEKQIADYGNKARDGKLSIEELTGGTFSISNGGVFGSMLSTPIINPPQSAILGIHATKERAVVEDGQIVIRPINYLALSYDHRIIDGREAVLGLVAMKELLEDPARLLLDL